MDKMSPLATRTCSLLAGFAFLFACPAFAADTPPPDPAGSEKPLDELGGLTPLRYQPYLLNSLGRVVSLSFRKAFNRNQ